VTETTKADATNIEIKLTNVRLSFADALFEPQVDTGDDGKERYSNNCVFLLDKVKDADQIKKIQAAMIQARDAKWPGQNKKSIPTDKRCLVDGEPADPDTNERRPRYDGWGGQMALSAKKALKAKTDKKVTLIGPKKTAVDGQGKPCFPRLTEADGLLYGGAYVNAIVRIYAFDGKGKASDGKNYPDRINCSLEAVQFKAHGEPFGAKRVDADSAFDEEDSDEVVGGTSAPAADDDPLG
jgi:hypothetical protein